MTRHTSTQYPFSWKTVLCRPSIFLGLTVLTSLVRPLSVYPMGDKSSDEMKLSVTRKKPDIWVLFYFFPPTSWEERKMSPTRKKNLTAEVFCIFYFVGICRPENGLIGWKTLSYHALTLGRSKDPWNQWLPLPDYLLPNCVAQVSQVYLQSSLICNQLIALSSCLFLAWQWKLKRNAGHLLHALS